MNLFKRRGEEIGPGEPRTPDEALALLRIVRSQMPREWAVPGSTLIQRSLKEVRACLAFLNLPEGVRESLGRAIAEPDDSEKMHQAGWTLADIGLSDIAIGVLAFALPIDPSRVDTAIELALALEAEHHRDAARVLRSNSETLRHPAGAGLLARSRSVLPRWLSVVEPVRELTGTVRWGRVEPRRMGTVTMNEWTKC